MALLSLIGPATKLLGKFIEDKDQKNKLAHSIATMAEKHANELAKGQIDINKEQAKHPSIFVSGAQPAVPGVKKRYVGICKPISVDITNPSIRLYQ